MDCDHHLSNITKLGEFFLKNYIHKNLNLCIELCTIAKPLMYKALKFSCLKKCWSYTKFNLKMQKCLRRWNPGNWNLKGKRNLKAWFPKQVGDLMSSIDMRLIPPQERANERWGKKLANALRGLEGGLWAIQRTWALRVFQKPAWGSSWKRQIDVGRHIKERSNGANRPPLGKTWRKDSKNNLKHALVLEVSLHGKHPRLTHFVGNKKNIATMVTCNNMGTHLEKLWKVVS